MLPPPFPQTHPDSDADGLDDTWEILNFRQSPGEPDAAILAKHGGDSDPDADRFDNLSEQAAGTSPLDPHDFPEARLVPVSDGFPSTDENGYAGSRINSVSIRKDNVLTVGDFQFVSFYRRHREPVSHPDNNNVAVARRRISQKNWEVFGTTFKSLDIDDAQNVVSIGVDGTGILHMSWGMHADPFLYAKSDASVLGSIPIRMVSLGKAGMTNLETGVTYPAFLTIPNGDMLFLFREGGSGSGDTYLNRCNLATGTWTPVHKNGTARSPLFQGTGFTPNYNLYPDRMALGKDGV
jgi:hypothetical protein